MRSQRPSLIINRCEGATMTATELTIYDLPVKPSADPGRTPALIG